MDGLLDPVGSEVIMAEQMTEEELITQEWRNTGTTWTKNDDFERDGYYIIRNLWDPQELYSPVPSERGQLTWWGNRLDQFNVDSEVEQQVEGSLARYKYPQYKRIHVGIRKKLEKELGRSLYDTYYYDRFYFPGQELTKHADRDACEISVTVHVSTNLNDEWPIWIKTPDKFTDKSKIELVSHGEDKSVVLKPGDGMVYKGCERPHWRESMPGMLEMSLTRINNKPLILFYYHQIFFHYVLQDGHRAHCAWDSAR